MAEKNPYESFLNEMNELIQFIDEAKFQPDLLKRLPKDFPSKLAQLELMVNILGEATDQAIAKCGITEAEIKKTLQDPSELPPEQREYIQASNQLTESMGAKIHELKTAARTVRKKSGPSKKKGASKERQQKFNPLGTKKGWKPL